MAFGEGKRVIGIIMLLPVLATPQSPGDHIRPGLPVPAVEESFMPDDYHKGEGKDNYIEPGPKPCTQQIPQCEFNCRHWSVLPLFLDMISSRATLPSSRYILRR